MLIAHTADTHLDERDPHATLEEQVAWLKWIGEDAAGAKLMLHAGDVFDSISTPAERRAAIEVFTFWAERMPVVLVRGNHDRPGDLYFLGRIRSRHPIHVLEQDEVVEVGGAMIACLPWPRRAYLAAAMGATSGLDLGQAAADGLRQILLSFKVAFSATSPSSPRILLAHAELGGARLDSGQPVAAHCDVTLSEADLEDTGADYVALGHIHRSQTLGRGWVRYPGSPRPTAFGQDDDPKGYSLVNVAHGHGPVIRHRVSPARPLVTREAEWLGHGLNNTGTDIVRVDAFDGAGDAVPGAAMRLVYEVDESERRAAAEAADRIKTAWITGGAHSVKVDPQVRTVHRVRAESLRTATSTADRVRTYWSSRGETPARSTHILSKLASLEAA